MPSSNHASCPKYVRHFTNSEISKSITTSSAPRPPVPPRRHTLAEICRYADEQCAYIEWMTRTLEAEEAARRHSSPTTPAGAITNPFSGPADMWWRPMSANDMYGKSELRRRQEEEQEVAQRSNPYLATSGFRELVERDSRTIPLNTYLNDTAIEEKITERILPLQLTQEPFEINEVPTVEDKNSNLEHEAWLDTEQAFVAEEPCCESVSFDLPVLAHSSIVLMIPKVILCFLLLPFVLMVLWESGAIVNDDGEE